MSIKDLPPKEREEVIARAADEYWGEDTSGNTLVRKPVQTIEKVVPYWPYCTTCRQPYDFHEDEPFASCNCGTTEWGYPRPADFVQKPSSELPLCRNALGNLLCAVRRNIYSGFDARTDKDLTFAIKEAEQLLGPPYSVPHTGNGEGNGEPSATAGKATGSDPSPDETSASG